MICVIDAIPNSYTLLGMTYERIRHPGGQNTLVFCSQKDNGKSQILVAVAIALRQNRVAIIDGIFALVSHILLFPDSGWECPPETLALVAMLEPESPCRVPSQSLGTRFFKSGLLNGDRSTMRRDPGIWSGRDS